MSKKYVNMLLWPLEDFYYHHYNHALEVYERSIYIWKKEWLNDDELEIIWLSALFHDTWFIIQYDNNEYIWAKIARNFLKAHLYSDEKISQIEELIISTDPLKKPINKMSEILKDADTDNLWRDDFFDKSEKLKLEIETIKSIKIKYPDWYHYSLEFLTKFHEFKTKTSRIERYQKKQENILKLKEKLNTIK